jgi:YesN/AraC family two-component response regulator
MYTDSELNQIIIHSKFIDFLNTLLQLKSHNIYTNDTLASPTTKKMYEISSYIHNHFHEELSLDFLANQFYLSPYYLSHQFKKVTNFTVSTYIQMTRIKNAQCLLVETDRKITDIAHSCGFTSFTQFNRVFNKLTHMPPRDFRKNGNIGNN